MYLPGLCRRHLGLRRGLLLGDDDRHLGDPSLVRRDAVLGEGAGVRGGADGAGALEDGLVVRQLLDLGDGGRAPAAGGRRRRRRRGRGGSADYEDFW